MEIVCATRIMTLGAWWVNRALNYQEHEHSQCYATLKRESSILRRSLHSGKKFEIYLYSYRMWHMRLRVGLLSVQSCTCRPDIVGTNFAVEAPLQCKGDFPDAI